MDTSKASASSDWERWFVPSVYPMTLLQLAEERGGSAVDLLRRAAIDAAPRDIAESGLTLGAHMRLVSLVADEFGDATVGVEMGWRLPPTALGSLGYALLASPTLRDALSTLQRFWHLVGQGFVITVDEHAHFAHMELRASLFITERIRVNAQELTLASMYRGLGALAPGAEVGATIWFDAPAPPHAELVRERLGDVLYEMPTTKVILPAAHLDRALVMANPVGFRNALAWCEREEKERGLTEVHSVTRTMSELRLGDAGYPTLADLARRAHVSPRSLRRHLAREGTTYSEMLEHARRRDALRLLDNAALSVRDVAELLGYENPANFTRAFRRWTGTTPSAHREATRRQAGS